MIPSRAITTNRVAPLEVLETRADVVVGRLHNLIVVLWTATPTYESSLRIGPLYKQMAADFPDGFALLVVIPEGVKLPEQRVRDLASESMRAVRASLRAVAGVFEAKGMLAAAMRAALATMALLARTEVQPRVFGDHTEALAWIQGYIRDGRERVTVAHLGSFVESLRARGIRRPDPVVP